MDYICLFVAFLQPSMVLLRETNMHGPQIKGRNRFTAEEFLSDWQTCWNPSDDKCNGSCIVHRDDICNQKQICLNLNECDLKCDSHYLGQASNKCVPRSTICDGVACNGCEEDHGWKNGVGFKCRREGRECVLPQQLLHDDISDCDGGTDLCFGLKFPLNETTRNERQTSDNLFHDKCFQCLNDVMLIPFPRVCDGVIDCDDLSDECLCQGVTKPEICNKVVKFGKKINAIDDDNAVNDPSTLPAEGSDQATSQYIPANSSQEIEGSSYFKATGTTANTVAIHNSEFRKRFNTTVRCDAGAVECEPGRCIPRSSICNGVRDCENDERFDYCQGTIDCGQAERYEEICRCGLHKFDCMKTDGTACDCQRKYGKACNNIADCTYTPRPGPVAVYMDFPDDECKASCFTQNATYPCVGLYGAWMQMSKVGPPMEDLSYSDEIGCSLLTEYVDYHENNFDYNSIRKIISSNEMCDGVEDCELRGDESESNCPDRFRCKTNKPGYISIKREQTCDGILDCKDGSDEIEKLCGAKRFACPSLSGKRVSIDKALVCDFMITCDDGSDEKNCNDGRFYCENGDPLFVRERQKFNGRGDCSDWSDEYPMLNQTESTNAFSSRYELIENPFLRALVWIIGLLSILGNATVLYIETKKLKKFKKLKATVVTNRLLVLNLAVSDIMMGIYLLSLAIAGVTMQGQYCSKSLLWRSSTSCVALGVLSVLSSETSVITMVLLTSCRLYAVLRPFRSASRPKIRFVGLMMLAAWAASLTISLVPLAPQLSGFFVTHAKFQYTPFARNVQMSLDEARELFSVLMTYDLKPNVTVPDEFSVDQLSWRDLESTADRFFVHEHFKIEQLFSYYSIDSVCIPKFFISKSDRAWGFSFFVNLFNFCSFTFVAASYLAIHLKTRKNAAMRASEMNSSHKRLQAKILRLIITDFCCWVPICVMAFAKLGGAYVSDNAYVFAAIVLLPINSALNPLLYSDLPDILYRIISGKLERLRTTISSFLTRMSSVQHELEETEQTANSDAVSHSQKSTNGFENEKNETSRL